MSEEIIIDSTLTKEEKYKQLLPQIRSLVEGEKNLTTNLAQICAALKYGMDGFFWIGFYFIEGDELVLVHFRVPLRAAGSKYQMVYVAPAQKERKPSLFPMLISSPGTLLAAAFRKAKLLCLFSKAVR